MKNRLFTLFLIAFVLLGCKSMSIKNNTLENGCIPWSYGSNQDQVLLCANNPSKMMTNQFRKTVDKNYSGAFMFVDTSGIGKDSEYQSIEKYPFILFYDNSLLASANIPKLFDRKNKRFYYMKLTTSPGNKGGLAGYLSNLDAKRMAEIK